MNYPAWQLKKADPAAETSLAGAGCGVLLRRVLAARGCTDPAAAQALLGQGEPLSDPFLLTDMDKAVVRIQEAIENEELMVIYGDYDVDGITSTSLVYSVLRDLGASPQFYIPERESEGYGLNEGALEQLSRQADLLITVDCGISSHDLVQQFSPVMLERGAEQTPEVFRVSRLLIHSSQVVAGVIPASSNISLL